MTTILYIEDNDANFVLVKKLLEKSRNYNVIRATNIPDVIKLYKEKKETKIDLIFVDITLPGESGLDFPDIFSKVLNDDNSLKKVPLIALTARVMKEDIDEYKKKGFDDYLGKPFNLSDLWKTIDKYIK